LVLLILYVGDGWFMGKKFGGAKKAQFDYPTEIKI
jgi:hypothetical protein